MDFFQFAEDLKIYNTSKFLDDLQIEIEKNQYVKQLQLQQWNEGKAADGSILGLYSKATEIITDGRKKAGTTFDIFDTGETRRKLSLFATQENQDLLFYFDSDSKALPDLLERIGSKLFGLEAKNIGQFVDISQGVAIQLFKKNLKLT